MNILHVIGALADRYGGPSKACFEMARAVVRRGHTVSILTTDNDGPAVLDVPIDTPVERDGVTLRYFPATVPRYWCRSPAMERALVEAIRRADVVHLHSLYLFHDKVTGRECWRAGVPYLFSPHGSLDPYLYRRHRFRKWVMEAWFQNAVTRGAAAVHFTTEEEGRLARPHVFGVPGVVVPLGLDLDEYQHEPLRGCFRTAHPSIGSRPIVLFLGRLNFKLKFRGSI